MRSAFHDTAVVNIHDLIAVADRGQTVGDNERCSALQHRIEARLQCFLGLHVDTRGCLIENQNRRIRKQRSRKRDQLFLALAQHGAALPHLGLIAVRHFC